ncbi:MAG TPA: rhodanese-like domain-containing protein, partial [Caldilineaceae bacterium]|nr:rhodanese-like domain-containing protein [Caldilineaceae bacterium]
KHLPELFSDPGREPEAVATIDGDTATRLIGEGVLLLDVRTPPEFDAAHIAEADNLPLQQIAAEHIGKILPEDKSTPIVTICGVGKRSYAAAQILNQLGYEHVMSVDGGMQLWLGEGRPLKIRR